MTGDIKNYHTLSQTAQRSGVSIPTAFNWRHKILDNMKNLEDDSLSGIVEADDTFFLHSQKGNRNIGRTPLTEHALSSRSLSAAFCILTV